jgi:hypothetical protein
MQTFFIKARVRNPATADVYAAGEHNGLHKVGTIERAGKREWEAHGLVYASLQGACMDVARRFFAIEPGVNNPEINLIYRSK